jgi:Flp pilus assembly protein TadG
MKLPARIRVLCKADHGASLAELAMVTPVLLLLTFGAVDLGRWYYVGLEVANAAHAGAEYGSLHPSVAADIVTAAQQSETHVPDVSYGTPTVTYGCECSDGSSYTANCSPTPSCTASTYVGGNVVHRVKVTTTAVYTTLVPWPGIPSSFTLSSTATIRGN